MGYIKNDSGLDLFNRSDMSPALVRFIRGIDSGNAPLDWGLLSEFAQDDGSIFRVIGSYRGYDEQIKIYKKGRIVTTSKEGDDKKYRYKILTDKIITPSSISTYAWGGKSYHNFGLAVDIVVRAVGEPAKSASVARGVHSWDSLEKFYDDIGLLAWAKKCGLSWGGYWEKIYDPVHFEDENYALPFNPYNTECNFTYVKKVADADTKNLDDVQEEKKVGGGAVLGVGAVVLAVLGAWLLWGRK